MNQFSSAKDIQTFIESHISDNVKADAEAAGTKTLEMAKEWCKAGCANETAEYLKDLFPYLNGGGCVDASVFCGSCADRTREYFANNMLPCCIEDVVKKGIEVNNTSKTSSGKISCPLCLPYKFYLNNSSRNISRTGIIYKTAINYRQYLSVVSL